MNTPTGNIAYMENLLNYFLENRPEKQINIF